MKCRFSAWILKWLLQVPLLFCSPLKFPGQIADYTCIIHQKCFLSYNIPSKSRYFMELSNLLEKPFLLSSCLPQLFTLPAGRIQSERGGQRSRWSHLRSGCRWDGWTLSSSCLPCEEASLSWSSKWRRSALLKVDLQPSEAPWIERRCSPRGERRSSPSAEWFKVKWKDRERRRRVDAVTGDVMLQRNNIWTQTVWSSCVFSSILNLSPLPWWSERPEPLPRHLPVCSLHGPVLLIDH